MILPPPNDRVGEQSGSGEPTLDRQGRRGADEHLRRLPIAFLANELRFDDPRHYEHAGRRSSTSVTSSPIFSNASSPSWRGTARAVPRPGAV
jgi:hypothetical protein